MILSRCQMNPPASVKLGLRHRLDHVLQGSHAKLRCQREGMGLLDRDERKKIVQSPHGQTRHVLWNPEAADPLNALPQRRVIKLGAQRKRCLERRVPTVSARLARDLAKRLRINSVQHRLRNNAVILRAPAQPSAAPIPPGRAKKRAIVNRVAVHGSRILCTHVGPQSIDWSCHKKYIQTL